MSGAFYLQAINVSKVYSGHHDVGVRNINLDIKAHQITAIIGESGSGKSTLLKLLYGLLVPDEGKISFKQEIVWGPDVKLIPGHDQMKMVTQHTDDLNLYASVWNNIAVLLPNTNLKAKQERTTEVLKQMNMLHFSDKRISELSGGEKQRVAIARALVLKPEVLLLDEPFNQVDTSFREGLQRDIRAIVKDTGLTVVIVSHDPAEVLSMADELIVLKNGEIIETGDPKTLYQSPRYFYTARLLTNCNVINGEQARHLNIDTDLERVVIYPENIEIVHSFVPKKWTVKQVLFKGFYEELLLEHNDVTVKMLNTELNKYPEGKQVNIKVLKHLAF